MVISISVVTTLLRGFRGEITPGTTALLLLAQTIIFLALRTRAKKMTSIGERLIISRFFARYCVASEKTPIPTPEP
jgi:hypothetical protein